jgi:hypothetical protein
MKAKKVMRDEHGPRHVTPAGRSVFYDLFPKAEADELVMRSTLLRGLEQWLKESGLTQTQAAKTLGITQARVSDINAVNSVSSVWICWFDWHRGPDSSQG